MGRELRPGFTTGACAAAAAAGAARMLKAQRLVEEVDILLPAGFAASFRLAGQRFDTVSATCFVVKDAGDDPDVTHGVEVHAEVALIPPSPRPSPTGGEGDKEAVRPAMAEKAGSLLIEGGEGIGRVTKAGLAVPVGEWAINPVPRRMIAEAVAAAFPPPAPALRVRLSVPDGRKRAERTLNARLGIVGGLSILGTTGVVKPISHRAWTDTLEVALDVAGAADTPAVVLSTGRSSERAAMERLPLPEEAFIQMGDHVGYALEACHRRGVPRLVVAAQFAKLVKIAAGHPQTHAAASRLELAQLAAWARAAGLDGALAKTIELANTAREVYGECGCGHPLIDLVAERALAQLRRRVPGAAVALLLAGYGDEPARTFGPWTELTAREEG